MSGVAVTAAGADAPSALLQTNRISKLCDTPSKPVTVCEFVEWSEPEMSVQPWVASVGQLSVAFLYRTW